MATQVLINYLRCAIPDSPVIPQLEVSHSGIGVHSGNGFCLQCKASGYPKPMVLWFATDDVKAWAELNELPQEDVAIDEYTVSRLLRVDKAHSSMSGTYVCHVHLPSDLVSDVEPDGSLAATAGPVTDGLDVFKVYKTYYTTVVVYGMLTVIIACTCVRGPVPTNQS